MEKPRKSGVSEVGRQPSPKATGSMINKFSSDVISKQLRFGVSKKTNFFTFKWLASETNTEITRSVKFWHVRCNQREKLMLQYLRLRYFWGTLDPREVQFCFDHPRFLSDLEFNVLLSLRVNSELSREELVERSDKILYRLKGKRSAFRKNLISQWNGIINILADVETKPIPARKPFSGWVRSAAAVGSKKQMSSKPDPEILEVFGDDLFDEFDFMFRAILSGEARTNSLTLDFGFNRS